MITQTAIYNAGTNENLFGTSLKVTNAVEEALTNIYSYPEPDADKLRKAIAHKLQVRPTQVLVGNGSGELISLVVRAFCAPFHESSILSISPTFPLYQMEARTLGVRYQAAPLDSSFCINLDHLLQMVEPETRVCFISNPNNPTGSYLSKAQLEQLIEELPSHVTLVIDEAYFEYASAPDFVSALPYLSDRQNLIVLRTFSKAYGLASLRVGYMVANEAILNNVQRIKQPFNVNHLAQVAAEVALEDDEFLDYTLQETAIGKVHLQSIFKQLGVQYWPSEGNFLYIDTGLPVKPICQALQQQGILVRHSEDSHTLRITIGTQEHHDHLYQLFKDMLKPSTIHQDQVLAQILESGYVIANQADDDTESINATIALANLSDSTGTPAQRIALAYTRAFSACQQNENLYAGNLYSGTFGEMDMISAFNVLVNSTPLVKFGHIFSNLAIANAIANAGEVHIMDLGIGSGLQWFHLLDLLAKRPGGAPKVRFTGVDIPAATGDPRHRLLQTGKRLLDYAQAQRIQATYECIASKLEEYDLQSIKLNPSEVLVINSALTLHHIPDQLVTKPDPRDLVLQQIHALKPAVFTLTEPDSEHNKLEFIPRLRESLRHYYTVFEVLDHLLPKQMPERLIIEQEFFGREIINVMSCEGIERVERHERNEAWNRRLKRLGFKPTQDTISAAQVEKILNLQEDFTLISNEAGYTLHWKGTPIIAATAWIS